MRHELPSKIVQHTPVGRFSATLPLMLLMLEVDLFTGGEGKALMVSIAWESELGEVWFSRGTRLDDPFESTCSTYTPWQMTHSYLTINHDRQRD